MKKLPLNLTFNVSGKKLNTWPVCVMLDCAALNSYLKDKLDDKHTRIKTDAGRVNFVNTI